MVKQEKSDPVPAKPADEQRHCGLVMPISTLDGLSAEHWVNVKEIISQAVENIEEPRFRVDLVSEADDAGLIHKRIVQNVYNADVVICDVSGKNPNVMFELGLRLAFDRAVVIVKDDRTDYSFDTGVLEHVPYPRDLRYNAIVAFKEKLAAKVVATYLASQQPGYSAFLKAFGEFTTARISEKEVTLAELFTAGIEDLRSELSVVRRSLAHIPRAPASPPRPAPVSAPPQTALMSVTFEAEVSEDRLAQVLAKLRETPGVVAAGFRGGLPGSRQIVMVTAGLAAERVIAVCAANEVGQPALHGVAASSMTDVTAALAFWERQVGQSPP